MGKCVIFCAGEFDAPVVPVSPEDCILAADGGLCHVQRLGLVPREILGDFDSLGYVPDSARVFPVEKDDTDAMLAVRRGLELGYREFILYGSLDGPRLDHTLANLQTLLFLAAHGARGYLVGKHYLITAVQGESLLFSPAARGIISLFCMGKPAVVSITGLKYTLDRGTLTADFPLGVSNHFMGKPSRVRVEEGCVLALWDRENGLPDRA